MPDQIHNPTSAKIPEPNPPTEDAEALDQGANSNDYIVAAYYFGNFHVDPRNESAHGKGWTEWQLVRDAKPRFPGHSQPKVPLWGYEDESEPKVFEKKIAAAKKGAVSAFIFDWYYYNDGPFLDAALEKGYMNAGNRNDVKFALMWANHDWTDIHPAKMGSPPYLQFPGQVTPDTFEKITSLIVERYFSQENYLKIDGCPYFSVYELYRFVVGMVCIVASLPLLHNTSMFDTSSPICSNTPMKTPFLIAYWP